MQADFSQRTLLTGRFYKLERNGVAVTTKTLLSTHSFHVPFESIPPKAEEITSSPRKWLVASIVFSVITLIATPILLTQSQRTAGDLAGIWFWGGLAALCWVVFFFKRASLLIYAQGAGVPLILFADRPSSEEVKAFVRKLFLARNKFLREKYARFAPAEPLSDRLARLEFLRDQEVLPEEEYQFLRRQESGDAPRTQGPAGFARQ
jgi:hypothetical protein